MFRSKKKEKETQPDEAFGASARNMHRAMKNLSDKERAFVVANCVEPLYVDWIEIIKDNSRDSNKRILVIGKYRLYQIKKSKLGGSKNVTKNVHYYDIKKITCHKAGALRLDYMQGDALRSLEVLSLDIAEILCTIRTAYREISLGFDGTRAFELIVTEESELKSMDPNYTPGPCGSFLETYNAYCDLLETTPYPGVASYIQYQDSTGDRRLVFGDVPGSEPGQATSMNTEPFFKALACNIHFLSLEIEGVTGKRLAEQLAETFEHNKTITRLVLRGLQSSGNGWLQFGNALARNSQHAVQVLDLSGNKLEQHAFASILNALKVWPHALHTLNLAKCSLTAVQFFNLATTLRSNFGMSLSLRNLDLSYNKFNELSSQDFGQWLEECGGEALLEYFSARNSDIHLSRVAPPLRYLKHLKGLDIIGCKLGVEASSLQELATQSLTLNHLALSGVSHHNREVAALTLKQFLRNPKLDNATLEVAALSDYSALSDALSGSSNLHTLNLTGCTFKESELQAIVASLAGIDTLREVVLDNCLQTHTFLGSRVQATKDSKDLSSALAALVGSNKGVATLSLRGSYKHLLPMFFQSLANNDSLKALDITDNDLSDAGGQALAACLMTNKGLQNLKCDKNGFTVNTWLELKLCLMKYNTTLLSISIPWADMQRLSSSADVNFQRFSWTLEQVNQCLRNNQHMKLGHEAWMLKPKTGLCLSFESEYLPTTVEPSVAVAGKFADIQQLAMNAVLSVETDPAEAGYLGHVGTAAVVSPRSSLSSTKSAAGHDGPEAAYPPQEYGTDNAAALTSHNGDDTKVDSFGEMNPYPTLDSSPPAYHDQAVPEPQALYKPYNVHGDSDSDDDIKPK